MREIAELPNCRIAELRRPDARSVRLQARTKTFALRLMRLVDALPNKTSSWVVGKQVLRSGTSIGANYHEACKARSKAEFTAVIGIVSKEAAETLFWLELLSESGLVRPELLEPLIKESRELSAIFTSSYNTARGH